MAGSPPVRAVTRPAATRLRRASFASTAPAQTRVSASAAVAGRGSLSSYGSGRPWFHCHRGIILPAIPARTKRRSPTRSDRAAVIARGHSTVAGRVEAGVGASSGRARPTTLGGGSSHRSAVRGGGKRLDHCRRQPAFSRRGKNRHWVGDPARAHARLGRAGRGAGAVGSPDPDLQPATALGHAVAVRLGAAERWLRFCESGARRS